MIRALLLLWIGLSMWAALVASLFVGWAFATVCVSLAAYLTWVVGRRELV